MQEARWKKVERSISEAKKQLEQASIEEQFQSIGLLCRETLISLAQAVYNAEFHTTEDGILPSNTDAARMLEAYFGRELQGNTNKATRKFAKAALDLTNTLQHKRTATARDAKLCLESTNAVVSVVSVIAENVRPSAFSTPFENTKTKMPNLFSRMKQCLEHNSLIRCFFLAKEMHIIASQEDCFRYNFEDYSDLKSKVKILEINGFVTDITTENYRKFGVEKYRMSEGFAEKILTL